jgi:hypothetical protein
MAGERNEAQIEFDAFGKTAGMTKHSGSWYRACNDVIIVLGLQKSQYSLSYYVNVGWWLLPLGDAKFPKEHELHVRIRLDALLPDRADEAKALLDLERPIENRSERLRELLESGLRPTLEQTNSVEGLRVLRRESRLKAAAVRGPAVPLLEQALAPGN